MTFYFKVGYTNWKSLNKILVYRKGFVDLINHSNLRVSEILFRVVLWSVRRHDVDKSGVRRIK